MGKSKIEQDKRDWEGGGTDQAAMLNSTATTGSTGTATFEPKLEGGPRIRAEYSKQSRESQGENPTTGSRLECVKGSETASVREQKV